MCVSLFLQKNNLLYGEWNAFAFWPLVTNSDHVGEEPELSSHWFTLGSIGHTTQNCVLPVVFRKALAQDLSILAVVVGRGGSQHLWSMESPSLSHEVIISFHSYNNSLRVSAAIIPVYGWEIWAQKHYIFAQAQATTKFSLGFEADRGHTS